jgi:ketosteroid isomerase-like protein
MLAKEVITMQTVEERISERVLELDRTIEKYHSAAEEFIRGNPGPYKELFSRRDDLVLANPFNPIARGWSEAKETMERAASQYKDGQVVGFENVAKYVDHDLAFIVEIERFKAKIGKIENPAPIALRTTTIFRLEDNGWKIIHRHADPITSARPWESVAQV